MRTTIILSVILLGLGGSIAGWYFSDHEVAKRKLIATLEEISAAATAMDQPKLLSQLDQFYAADGKITLNVQFSVLTMGSSGTRGWQYEHNKQQFAAFLTEMIGKVDTYGMQLTLGELMLDEVDSKKFKATIRASGFGTGASIMMGRSMATRYVIMGDCTISGVIDEAVSVSTMDCPITLRQQADLSGAKFRENLEELKGLKP